MADQTPLDVNPTNPQMPQPLDPDQTPIASPTLPPQAPRQAGGPPVFPHPPLMRRQVPASRVAWLLLAMLAMMVGIVGGGILLRDYRVNLSVERRQSETVTAPLVTPIAQVVQVTQPVVTPMPAVPVPTSMPAAPVDTPTAEPAEAGWLLTAEADYQRSLEDRDPGGLEHVLDFLDRSAVTDPRLAEAASVLASQAAFARDTLKGVAYLNSGNTVRWQLADPFGAPLPYPIDMTISDGGIYVIDSGALYRADLAALPASGGVLTMTAVLTPTQLISGYPVKEIVAVDGAAYSDAVFVLDKSNDIYRYHPSSGRWSLELPLAREYRNPDPFYINLSTYAERLYMLDPARNQIWRHADSYQPPEYFADSKLPWLLNSGDPDVSSGLDMAIDGNIYVLARDGSIGVYNPAPVASFSLEPADQQSLVAGLDQTTAQPMAIIASGDGVTLYVADPGQRRVVALDRRNGQTLHQVMAPDNIDFAYLHGIAEHDDQLLILAASRLYGIDLSQGITATAPLIGHTPLLASRLASDRSQLRPADMAPNDPVLPSVIASYGFTMPVQDALLPDRSAIYPGSRRAYRYGVHEGLDIYGRDVGVDLAVGTPVVAAADGVILRADVGYQELSPQTLNDLLADAHARHDTPRDSLDKLGGRQVWIDHGAGLVTTYAHLDSIAEGIQVGQPVRAGQVIGAVGVSGTPDGAAGITQFAHLHFEIRIGNAQQYFLGQWLSIEETRRAFEQIFQVPVRPAYLDFRQ